MIMLRRITLATIGGGMLASVAVAQTVVYPGPAVQQPASTSALPAAGQVRINPNPPTAAAPAEVVRGETVVNQDPAPAAVVVDVERGRVLTGPAAGRSPAEAPVIEGVINTPYTTGILSQSATSRPFGASNYAADGQFTIFVTNGDCATAFYTVSASPIAGTAPDGSTPPFANVGSYIGFEQGDFLFDNAGAGAYQVTVTETSGTCIFDPAANPQTFEVVIAQDPLDGPIALSIENQTATSRPVAASDYTANASFTMRTTNPATCSGTYTVNASPVAGSGPGGTTPPLTTVTAYIGFPQGTFFFNNAGAGQYTVTATETGPECVQATGDDQQVVTVTIAEGPLDGPIELSIETQTDTTRPVAAPDYLPNGSFTMRTTDPATCSGTYTVNASPVAGSGPGGTTPPLTTITTYIGFPQQTFLFNNAGAGQYTVTATETGGQCAQAPGDDQRVLTVTINQGPFDTPYTQSIASQTNTSLPFSDPGYAPDGQFTMAVADGSCAGTYTVNASPVAGSGPGGSTPPNTTIVTYIGFPEGNFLFANAGIGDYLVTVTETGSCTFEPGNDPQTRVVSIAGNTPVLGISPASVDFGDIEVGIASAPAAVTLSNSGTANLLVSSLDAATAPFALEGGNCGPTPISIPIGGNCTLEYSFNPTATGPANQTLNLSSTATPANASFALAGNGVQAAATLDLSLLSFGPINVGQGETGVVTVSSNGNVDLVISEITAPAAPFSISGGSCLPTPTSLAPSESCTIEVLFLPGTAEGDFTSSFDIISNAVSSPDAVELQGTSLPLLAVPTLDRFGLLLLALALMLLAGASLRRGLR